MATPGCAVQGWARGDSRTSPPQGREAPREPPSSGLRGISLQFRDLSPNTRGLASVLTTGLKGGWVTAWELGRGQRPVPSGAAGQLGREGPGCQVSTQKFRVIRRQKLRLRLLRATSTASWKTAWTFSRSRAEHSR